MNILLEAYLSKNFGDDLFITLLTMHYKDHTFYLLKNGNCSFAGTVGKETRIHLISQEEAHQRLDEFDAYVLVGGDFYHPHSDYTGRMKRAESIKKKGGSVLILGASLYKDYPEDRESVVGRFFEAADIITFRDSISYAQCLQMAPEASAFLSCDMAFTLVSKYKRKNSSSKPCSNLGISVRRKMDATEEEYETYCKLIAEIIVGHLNADADHCVSLLSLSTSDFDDRDTADKILNMIPGDLAGRVRMLDYSRDVFGYIEQIDACDAIVSTRFHALCMALILGKPFFPINYEAKVENLLMDLGYTGKSVEYGAWFDPHELLDSIAENHVDPEKYQGYVNKADVFFALSDILLNVENGANGEENVKEIYKKVNSALYRKMRELKQYSQNPVVCKNEMKECWKGMYEILRINMEYTCKCKERLSESEALVQEKERQLSNSAIRIEGCEKECNEAKAALEEQKKQMLSLQAGLGQLKADVAALEYWLDVAGRSKPLKLAHFVTQCKHALIGMPEEKKESRRWLCGDRSFVPKYSYLHQSAVSAARIRMSLEHISMHSDVQELRQNSMTAPGLDAKAFGAILDQYDKRTVIVFPELVDWNIPLFQRPQQMAMAFAKLGIMFIFVTPNGNDNVHQMKQLMDNCILMPPEHFEAAMDMLLDRKLDIILDICSTDNRHFMPWVERYTRKGCKVLYEYIDEISDDITGRVPKETYERHSAFLKDKNVWVVATADKLYNEVIQLRGGDENCLNSGNGVDLDHFRVEKNIKKVPKPIQSIVKKDKPVIGYFGAIANWFDFEMIEYAAKQRKEYEFLMIGPNYGTHNLDCLATLKEIPNLHFVGAVDYKTLPYVASYFTVATIPFLLNDITESTSPIKLFEYMAMGKPVVTTAMRECFKYPVVRIAKDKEDFVAALDESVAKAEDERFLMEIAGEAERNSWIKKAEELAELTGMNKAEV